MLEQLQHALELLQHATPSGAHHDDAVPHAAPAVTVSVKCEGGRVEGQVFGWLIREQSL